MYARPAAGLENTARGRRGAGAAAQLRALRVLPAGLPHLPRHRQRARQPARPHLPDQAARRGRAGLGDHPRAPRPLPHLPRLRARLPVRRRVRATDRSRPRARGRTRAAAGDRSARCARHSSAVFFAAAAVRGAAADRPGGARRWLPAPLQARIPPRPAARAAAITRRAMRGASCCSRVACSPASAPGINAATARVLDRLGIGVERIARRAVLRRARPPPRPRRPRARAGAPQR